MIKSVLPVMAATLLITVLLVVSCGGTPSTTTPISATTPTNTPPTTTPTNTPPTTPPIGQCKADFVADITSTEIIPCEIQFSDKSIGDISSWAWDFDGDSVIDSTEQNPTYTYYLEAFYTVSLTVTGDNCKDTMTKRDYITIGCGC